MPMPPPTLTSANASGFWGPPHTSSIDFCEENYAVTPFVAEFHNTWSSIPIAFVGLFGYLYANPTKEVRFSVMYLVFFVIGLGSVMLHATLMKFPQSFDEIPMVSAHDEIHYDIHGMSLSYARYY
jgi:dihydroceramidase